MLPNILLNNYHSTLCFQFSFLLTKRPYSYYEPALAEHRRFWQRRPSHPDAARAHTWFWRGAFLRRRQFYVYRHHECETGSAYQCRNIFCGQASLQARFCGEDEEEASRYERGVSASDVRFCFFGLLAFFHSPFFFCVLAHVSWLPSLSLVFVFLPYPSFVLSFLACPSVAIQEYLVLLLFSVFLFARHCPPNNIRLFDTRLLHIIHSVLFFAMVPNPSWFACFTN